MPPPRVVCTKNNSNNAVSPQSLLTTLQGESYDRLKKKIAIDKITHSTAPAFIAPKKCFLLICVLFLFSLDNCCLNQASASPVYPYYENTLDPIETRSFQFNRALIVNNQLAYGAFPAL